MKRVYLVVPLVSIYFGKFLHLRIFLIFIKECDRMRCADLIPSRKDNGNTLLRDWTIALDVFLKDITRVKKPTCLCKE
jgi:hypothetical protein